MNISKGLSSFPFDNGSFPVSEHKQILLGIPDLACDEIFMSATSCFTVNISSKKISSLDLDSRRENIYFRISETSSLREP